MLTMILTPALMFILSLNGCMCTKESGTRDVPPQCLKKPESGRCRAYLARWSYNSSLTKCVIFKGCGNEKDSETLNNFETEDQCMTKCRDPHLGECGAGSSGQRCRNLYPPIMYRFNANRQSCEAFPDYNCGQNRPNVFYSPGECYKTCGRFVSDQCKLPILNEPSCRGHEKYGYNPKTRRCERFFSCTGGMNAYPTPKECWENCDHDSVCLKSYSSWKVGIRTRYVYDIAHNTCIEVKVWDGSVEGKNKFTSFQDCEKTCRPVYKPMINGTSLSRKD